MSEKGGYTNVYRIYLQIAVLIQKMNEHPSILAHIFQSQMFHSEMLLVRAQGGIGSGPWWRVGVEVAPGLLDAAVTLENH